MTSLANPVFITLGSNIAPETNLVRAAERLTGLLDVRAFSRVYETPPINRDGAIDADQDVFLNAAVLVDTAIPIVALKFDLLRLVEAEMGRVRGLDKFLPRPIDLDIALYGDLVLQGDGLPVTVPDPDILTRAHIALPLADLAPDYRHPVTGETLAAIAGRFANTTGIRVRHNLSLAG